MVDEDNPPGEGVGEWRGEKGNFRTWRIKLVCCSNREGRGRLLDYQWVLRPNEKKYTVFFMREQHLLKIIEFKYTKCLIMEEYIILLKRDNWRSSNKDDGFLSYGVIGNYW